MIETTYRRRSVVEARQLTRESFQDICAWLDDSNATHESEQPDETAPPRIRVLTLQKTMTLALDGDWIVKDEWNDFIVVANEEFQQTYERTSPIGTQ